MKDFKIVGTVCEYNPFHYGHQYNFNTAKRHFNADYTVCVMSGSFVERGDVAIFDKWKRAECAVRNGADLVLELPAYYVLQSAKNFAYGAVKILDLIGVDYLTFGSESGDIEKLKKVADIVYHEPECFKQSLKEELSKGIGYPSAMQTAISKALDAEYISSPNDILGINYLVALNELKSGIIPYTVKRENSYHSKNADTEFASATAVRDMIYRCEDYTQYAPKCDAVCHSISNIEEFILGYIRLKGLEDKDCFKNITGMENGLDLRIIQCAKDSSTLDEFFEKLSCKRYTDHRLRRAVLACMIGLNQSYKMDYIRPLAFNRNGAKILSHINKVCPLPVISKVADFEMSDESMLNLDIRATDIASLCSSDKSLRYAGKDYKISPIFADV